MENDGTKYARDDKDKKNEIKKKAEATLQGRIITSMLELYFLLHLSPLIFPIVLTYYKFINNSLVITNVVTFIAVHSEGGWLQKL